jgi:hypothetical protein
MTTDKRFDQSVSRWLEETAPAQLPERVLEATFERTRKSRQHVGLRALLGRLSMPRFVPALGGAAIVVVAAAVAFSFFYFDRQGGLGASPSVDDPRQPFIGVWISTSDADGGTQTMTVERAANLTVEIVVTDTIATVCSGTPSTMTGTGTVDSNSLVIPTPDYRCDDGSEPLALSGPPLIEQLRNLTYLRDPGRDMLTVGNGVWLRAGAEAPSPEPVDGPTRAPDTTGSMWPQSSLEEVRAAQERADAGDPDYTWQVDSALVGDAAPWGAEVLDRFVREVLGWEQVRNGGGYAYGEDGSLYDELVFFRCAPGRTNPLYPDDAKGRGCAPTIDDFRYETVMLTLEQPARRDPSGIWVVTGWEMLQPGEPSNLFDHLYPDFTQRQYEQVAPPSEAEATALLEAFLGARVDGEGAEQYLHLHRDEEPLSTSELVPMLLYATTGGAPYERYETDLLHGPEWPSGWMDFGTRLFASDGTVVEQSFAVIRQEDGGLGLVYGYPVTDVSPTTENGQAVAVPYSFLDGTVTFSAALPWDGAGGGLGSGQGPTFAAYLGNPGHAERFEIMADPLPVEAGCEPGSAPTDAEALAQSILSDPDLEATVPMAVSVGGIDALQMDVVAAPGASVCARGFGGPLVITDGGDDSWAPGWLGQEGGRMRLYLLDLPEGSAQILAIAIAAPESEFERVVEAAAPIVDSIEFHVP